MEKIIVFKRKICIFFYKVCLCVLFFICLMFLTGCNKNENELETSKIVSEIDYLENTVYNIVDKFVEGEYEEDINISENIIEMKVIDYDKVKDDIKKLNKSLDVLTVDISKNYQNTNSITVLSKNINNLIINASENDINVILRDLNEVENSLILNLEKVSINESKKKIKILKSDILDVFINGIIYEEKEISKNKINDIISKFEESLNDKEFVNDNQYRINNVYVLLNEFKFAIDSENEDLIKIKYISLIEIL